MWNMHGTCSCNGGLQAQLLFVFVFVLQFYCFSKDIGFHKKRGPNQERTKEPFSHHCRTKANKKSCSDLLECEYHLNKRKVGKV